MANDMRYLSAEEEAKLLKPIDEYVGKIQAQIDALRVDGSDKVQALKTHISLTKEDKNYTKEEQNAIIRKDQELLVKAREVETANKDKVSKLIADAESYLKTHFKKDYYDKVAASCAAQKEAENAEYEKIRANLKAEHERTISGMTDKQELKDEKYVYKNRLYDAQMVHESKLQEIKDRKHEAFVHQYHLIDLLRMSKFTYGQKKLQKLENYKYTFNTPQFLYKNGLYIVIILIFIALCFITPVVKDTQLLTTGFASIAGFFMARFKMHPFISTMANMLIIFGLVTYATKGVSFGAIDSSIPAMFIPKIGNFPTIILWAVVAVAVVWFIWNKTTFGKNLYAVGGNPEAAAVSGISVFAVTMGAFVLAGILYGFGAWLECNRMIGSGSAAYGQGWDMDAIAACVVGGVSFTGGIGKISGVVTGVLIFTALTYSLTILGIDTNLQFIFEGIIILVAVTLDCLKYVKKK